MAVRRTTLVVEDEKDIRELVRFHLEQEGYAVREAETGEAALAQIAKERPALVVLDLMLPSTDGLEVCRRLRVAEATQGRPIIMLTAKAAEVDRVLGLELGADDYVTKPFSPRELVARVRAVMRRTHGEEVRAPRERRFRLPALGALGGGVVTAVPYVSVTLERHGVATLAERLLAEGRVVGESLPWAAGDALDAACGRLAADLGVRLTVIGADGRV